jgi:hypothetical protein
MAERCYCLTLLTAGEDCFLEMAARLHIQSVVDRLESLHGKPSAPNFSGPLEMILWENVVYLADDKKRTAAFETLRDEIGLTASQILSAPSNALLTVTRLAGILPHNQVEMGLPRKNGHRSCVSH